MLTTFQAMTRREAPDLACHAQVVGAHEAHTARLPLQSATFFSSTSSVWSQPGAGHYAAANAYLDALALDRQEAGLPTVALQYGPFAGTGMAAEHAGALAALGLHGLQPREVQPSEQA